MDAPPGRSCACSSLCAHSSVVYLSVLINKPLQWSTLLRQGRLSFRPHLGARQNLPSLSNPSLCSLKTSKELASPKQLSSSRKLLEVGRKAPINIPFKRKLWNWLLLSIKKDSIYLSPLTPSHAFSCFQARSVCSQKILLLIANPSQQGTVPLPFQLPGKPEPHFEKDPYCQGAKGIVRYRYKIGFIGGNL